MKYINTNEQKIKPSSSPATENIKSVWASGICSFKVPWPKPLPNIPPDLKALMLWSNWYVSNNSGSKNISNLLLTLSIIKYEEIPMHIIINNRIITKNIDKPATNSWAKKNWHK